MSIFIAQDKQTHAHYFFRVFSKKDVPHLSEYDPVPLLNKLMSAKSHKQLLNIIDRSCLLIDLQNRPSGIQCTMSPAQCLETLQSRFVPTDARLLASEMYLYSPTPRRANSSTRSPAAFRDAFEKGLPSMLETLGDENVVLVEQVQNWMMFRNSISLCAVLLSIVEHQEEDAKSLESAGFSLHPGTETGQFIASVPLKYGSALFSYFSQFDDPEALAPPRYRDQTVDVDELFKLYAEGNALFGKNSTTGAIPFVTSLLKCTPYSRHSPLHDPDPVFFSLSYETLLNPSNALGRDLNHAWGHSKEARRYLKSLWSVDRNVYVCATVNTSESHIDTASKILKSFWRASQTLANRDGEQFGSCPDLSRLFEPERNTMPIAFRSLISKSWSSLFYRGGARLSTCRHCGCAIISANKGPLKEYCSDSCRIQARS